MASKLSVATSVKPARHDEDFYTWTVEQAALIRSGHLDRIDLDAVAEEIEALGNEQAAKLRSAYRLIAMHLLKLTFQRSRATRSWRASIVRERSNVEVLLDDNPGLKPRRPALFLAAYRAARKEAAAETGIALTAFPTEPPFTLLDVENEAFWPGA